MYGRRRTSSANIDSIEAPPFIETCAVPKIEQIPYNSVRAYAIDTATQNGIAITLSLMHVDALILICQVCDVKSLGNRTCNELS